MTHPLAGGTVQVLKAAPRLAEQPSNWHRKRTRRTTSG